MHEKNIILMLETLLESLGVLIPECPLGEQPNQSPTSSPGDTQTTSPQTTSSPLENYGGPETRRSPDFGRE